MLDSDQEEDPTDQNLAGLNPPIMSKTVDVSNVRRWLNHVRLSQNVIDTITKSSYGKREEQQSIVKMR